MKKNINGGVGATPFGELIGIPTFIDASLLKQKPFINTGDYEYSIKLTRRV